ncbi:DUF4252 domain-containing protein [Mesonia aestuariivivens]|uniref:DUF4252 domain-containing protein n=1 Tax=Mesonia aestuariivivens TaxID=2796128 RepID=A0ABS6VYE7_9FLAO|nr:DUF4252 domain-containing protein [Mesonia aestuariivivens]MBW2960608.1 DUF4252 domain-containing protein [Mesonia aestuariivivens]
MKKLIIFITLAIFPLFIQAQSFSKYADMKGVSSMVMTSEMFKLLADIDFESGDPEVKRYIKLIENLEDIKILTTKNVSISSKMTADVNSYLTSSVMNKLMAFKDEGKEVVFYTKPGSKAGYVSQLFMFMKGEETVIMSITGDIDLREVSRLAQDLEVPGAEQLKNVNKK